MSNKTNISVLASLFTVKIVKIASPLIIRKFQENPKEFLKMSLQSNKINKNISSCQSHSFSRSCIILDHQVHISHQIIKYTYLTSDHQEYIFPNVSGLYFKLMCY